jgi:uncharacterized protein (TIGR03118 family)
MGLPEEQNMKTFQRFFWRTTLTLIVAFSPAVLVAQHYIKTNLVSDLPGMAKNPPDIRLKNPWGLARSSTSFWWVSDNGTGFATLYDGTGAVQPLQVTIPSDPAQSPTGTPTGAVFNGTSDFEITKGNPAMFLFVNEDGTISGWNPKVNPNAAIAKVRNSTKSVFKGAAIAVDDGKRFLYVADFRQAKILKFDTNFTPIPTASGAFLEFVGNLGFAPFNILNVGGNLYVTFAKQDQAKHDDVAGAGFGFVVAFDTKGVPVQFLQYGPWFNSPWGIALAPSDFGGLSHRLLSGQFGSGEILVFNPANGRFAGKMLDPKGNPIRIDGLWALSFASGDAGSKSGTGNTLYFTAGINDEADGLFGTLTVDPHDLVQGNGQ